eukprot:828203-Amphidinium_carterae.1
MSDTMRQHATLAEPHEHEHQQIYGKYHVETEDLPVPLPDSETNRVPPQCKMVPNTLVCACLVKILATFWVPWASGECGTSASIH